MWAVWEAITMSPESVLIEKGPRTELSMEKMNVYRTETRVHTGGREGSHSGRTEL